MAGPRAPRRRREPSGPVADLARALRDRRLHLGLTQQQLADLAGVSRDSVRELESGRGAPSMAAAAAVAAALGAELALAQRGESSDR